MLGQFLKHLAPGALLVGGATGRLQLVMFAFIAHPSIHVIAFTSSNSCTVSVGASCQLGLTDCFSTHPSLLYFLASVNSVVQLQPEGHSYVSWGWSLHAPIEG